MALRCRRFEPSDMDDLHLTLGYYADLPRFSAASRTDQCHRVGGAVHGGRSTAARCEFRARHVTSPVRRDRAHDHGPHTIRRHVL
jgi:hypothetical protein